ncbi:MAG: hypothetical protein ACSHWU_07150, partial [Marinicella sp.]
PPSIYGDICQGMNAANVIDPSVRVVLEKTLGHELLSAKLTELQIANNWIDARECFVVDGQDNLVNKAAARQALLKPIANKPALQNSAIHIVTGFIARDEAGNSTTLGRNGSDYSATLIAALFNSAEVYLWTDVDGVYTADPNVIPQAYRIPSLSLSEAQALSELGSHVLHQKTMAPILHKETKIVINTCQLKSEGTDVDRPALKAASKNDGAVKTLAHKANLTYFVVTQVSELQARQFQTQLTAAQINNFANHFDKTQNRLSFYLENKDSFKTAQLIKASQLILEEQQTGISLISAVGQHIRQNHQVITKILNRSAQFDIHNIHYPANDHTLCVLIHDVHANDLLSDLHQTFFGLEPSIPIVVMGYGNIGKQFLKILKANKSTIERNVKQSLSVVAIANSRHYQLDTSCLLDQAIELQQSNQQGELLKELEVYAGKPAVIIDLTASQWVAEQYVNFAANGWHLISANKIAAANDDTATIIEEQLVKYKSCWLKNTTVGAALPVQSSLRKLQLSGDVVNSVSGVFSGSLSWLFGHYDGQTQFMQWVKQAHDKAYTEPDPRDDLSGQDVYRKAQILARELGFKPNKVVFEPVIPEQFLRGSLEQFWQQQEGINTYMQQMWQQASEQNKSLRYLAQVTHDELRVELVAVDASHAAATLNPGDNIFIIDTQWYAGNPLVIQGPGAGREVTAAGVLNDLIDVLQSS